MQLKEDEEYSEDIYKGQPLSRAPCEPDIYHPGIAQRQSARFGSVRSRFQNSLLGPYCGLVV